MNDVLTRITVDPAICHGKPTVRGLRYPVSMILELLAGNMTPAEILADYPDLEREDISACLAFAARLSSVQRILPLAACNFWLMPSRSAASRSGFSSAGMT